MQWQNLLSKLLQSFFGGDLRLLYKHSLRCVLSHYSDENIAVWWLKMASFHCFFYFVLSKCLHLMHNISLAPNHFILAAKLKTNPSDICTLNCSPIRILLWNILVRRNLSLPQTMCFWGGYWLSWVSFLLCIYRLHGGKRMGRWSKSVDSRIW